MNFETTMTEVDFKRPLLNADEQRLARASGEPDLDVDGLTPSLLGWLFRLFGARPR